MNRDYFIEHNNGDGSIDHLTILHYSHLNTKANSKRKNKLSKNSFLRSYGNIYTL
ncbi:hypothetical protein Hanom_Chr00s000002g01599841 [Helianthus anomalus]